MRILIDDKIQGSDAAAALKSPALSDVYTQSPGTITLDDTYTIDCIGVGYTDATTITVNGEVVTLATTEKSGLYLLTTTLTTATLTITHDGTYIGRLAAGQNRFLGAAPSREPGFYTTAEPRVTASGQVIEGAGGYTGRRIDVDFRYKITSDIYDDITAAYPTQLSRGYPLFIYFDKETARMPYTRMYAATDNELLFQSSINRFLYSRKFSFIERF